MTNKPHYLGHRKRLRDKFLAKGSQSFNDYELLELLLTYSIPRKDVKPIAKALLNKFGSISGVFDADSKELEQIEDVGASSVVLFKLTKDLAGVYLSFKMKERDLLSNPECVSDFARLKLSGLKIETFMVIYLNIKNEVIECEVIHEGTVNRAVIYPRRIIERALAFNASGIILVHNHPSGYFEPSSEDITLTLKISEAAKIVDIRVVDHIVVAKEGFFSFRQNNILT